MFQFKRVRSLYMPLRYFLLGGFKDGVFPGVSLLSRWRLSGFPVDVAILFGPGFSGIMMIFKLLQVSNITNFR